MNILKYTITVYKHLLFKTFKFLNKDMNESVLTNNIVMHECNNGCCTYQELMKNNDIPSEEFFYDKRKKQKAGIFFYDIVNNKVLLVQSRGFKWGVPKGTREETDVNIKQCAVREVLEETGIHIDESTLNDCRYYRCDKAYYYYLEIQKEIPVSLQTDILENDASGIGWFNPNCLLQLIKENKIQLNSHTKTCFWIFLEKEMRL